MTVTRDGDLLSPASVSYRTVDGTATESGRDFVPIVGQEIVYEIGEREKHVTVTVLDDDLPEAQETFYVELYNAQGQGRILFIYFNFSLSFCCLKF